MCARLITKCFATFAAAIVSLVVNSLLAQTQDLPTSDTESFDIEPPLLIQPRELDYGRTPEESQTDKPETPLDAGKLARQLESAKKSAASAGRLVKTGVLSKTEAEQRALRVARLASDLAQAQMRVAQEQVGSEKARLATGQAAQADVDRATAALAQATAAAKSAQENYHKAQLENAALNLSRQRKLFSLGSAHKSDVTRAEEKLARLQQPDQARP